MAAMLMIQSFAKMPRPKPSSAVLVLTHISTIVRLVLTILRLVVVVLENAAGTLDLAMQEAATPPLSGNSSGASAAANTNCSENDMGEVEDVDMTSPNSDSSDVADVSPVVDVRGHSSCHRVTQPPLPIFCDRSTKSRRFYVVTVGHQVGVFDNRWISSC
jgi:hypothetical protein